MKGSYCYYYILAKKQAAQLIVKLFSMFFRAVSVRGSYCVCCFCVPLKCCGIHSDGVLFTQVLNFKWIMFVDKIKIVVNFYGLVYNIWML